MRAGRPAGSGNDDDRLSGGLGADLLTGGSGADTFANGDTPVLADLDGDRRADLQVVLDGTVALAASDFPALSRRNIGP